jgi:putative ATPase
MYTLTQSFFFVCHRNPSFTINGALLSRCRVLVLKKLKKAEIITMLTRALRVLQTDPDAQHLLPPGYAEGTGTDDNDGSGGGAGDNIEASEGAKFAIEPDAIDYIAELADGDGRAAINMFEIMVQSVSSAPAATSTQSTQPDDEPADATDATTTTNATTAKPNVITRDYIRDILTRTHLLYDRLGDAHYDTISALHKSVRGGNADAALFYLTRMLTAGEDPLYIARRLVRMASEDIGLADDTCLPFAVAAYTAVQQVGLPEADVVLAHCAVKLARARKSVMVYRGLGAVKHALADEPGLAASEVPVHLRNAPTRLMRELEYGKEYKYNPDFDEGVTVDQEYMPRGYESIKFLPRKHLGSKDD